MRIEDIIPIIGALGGGSLGGWWFGRKKQKAETKVVEGDALHAMQEAYRQMIQDTNDRLNLQSEKIDALDKELKNCKKMQTERSKQEFLKEYAASEFGLLIINYNGTIEYTNPTFDRYFGVKIGTFMGQPYSSYLSKKAYEESKNVWSKGKNKTELLDYTNYWTVEGKKKKCHWLKAYNDDFSQVAYCVLKIKWTN